MNEIRVKTTNTALDTETSAYVPPIQLTNGQPPPIAAHGGLSYMSFDKLGDAGTAAAIEDALKLDAEGEGRRVIEMLEKSPTSLRLLKAALNADCDGQAGLQQLAGDATMLFYMSEEGQEGRNDFNEKRSPDYSSFGSQP